MRGALLGLHSESREKLANMLSACPHMRVRCAALLLPGDSGQMDLQGLDEADIICTTPEKFGAPSLRQRCLRAWPGLIITAAAAC